MIFLYLILALLVFIGLVLALKIKQLKAGNKKAAAARASLKIEPLADIGSVNSFTLLPLVDYYTDDERLKTEAGVSYLIKADDTTLLMDVGFNKKKEHPSPLVHNMQALGVTLENLDYLFFSHLHLDHVGGMQEQKNSQFSLSQGPVSLPAVPVYAPTEMAPSHWNPGPEVKVINNPQVLSRGVASIGVIPRNLFLIGYTLENSLAVNIAGKGIVLVVGCGHQTIERIIERAQQLFDEPLYGIIGGLHFPVQGGRIMIGPFNLQNIVGKDTPPWKGINAQDVKSAIAAIQAVNPAFIALSPHDSSDWSLAQFQDAFGERCHELKVGRELKLP